MTKATMRALLYRGRGQLVVSDRPMPVPGSGDLLIEVLACGICGTDFTEVASGPHLTSAAIDGGTDLVLGHEMVGRVVERGANCTVPLGTRVVSGAGISCGNCRECMVDRPNQCRRSASLGLQLDGGLAEYCLVPEAIAVPVPDAIPSDTAALAQPAGVAVHAVGRAEPRTGTTALVVGAGGIGLFVVAELAARGIQTAVVDPDQHRAALARSLNLGLVQAKYPPHPADIVFETSGTQPGIHTALAQTRSGGSLVMVGLHDRPRSIDLAAMVMKEITMLGSAAQRPKVDIARALQLLSHGTSIWATLAPQAVGLDEARTILMAGRSAGTPAKVLVDPRTARARTASHTH